MKLYNKHLTSLAHLKRERYLMQYAKKVNHAEDLLAFDKQKGKKKKKKAASFDSGNALEMISSLIGGGTIAGGLLANKQLRKLVISRIPHQTVGKLAWEVFGGYLKWKAIELTYGIVFGAIKKQREKSRIDRMISAHQPGSRVHRR